MIHMFFYLLGVVMEMLDNFIATIGKEKSSFWDGPSTKLYAGATPQTFKTKVLN